MRDISKAILIFAVLVFLAGIAVGIGAFAALLWITS